MVPCGVCCLLLEPIQHQCTIDIRLSLTQECTRRRRRRHGKEVVEVGEEEKDDEKERGKSDDGVSAATATIATVPG